MLANPLSVMTYVTISVTIITISVTLYVTIPVTSYVTIIAVTTRYHLCLSQVPVKSTCSEHLLPVIVQPLETLS